MFLIEEVSVSTQVKKKKYLSYARKLISLNRNGYCRDEFYVDFPETFQATLVKDYYGEGAEVNLN